jgi:hypothetical protein
LQLKRQAAAGVDGETWRHYGEALEENLQNLSHRLKRGAYRAKPVRRVYIPKADGRQRPLGITALEDKLVQRATVEVLNIIYETDFLGFSYGFRPGRQPASSAECPVVRARRETCEMGAGPGCLPKRLRHRNFSSTCLSTASQSAPQEMPLLGVKSPFRPP